jgi:hypothetical protein
VAQLATQRSLVDEVHERALAVDLDDGKPLAIPGFELWIAADVDLLEVEPQLVSSGSNRGERSLAKVTARRVVEDDSGRYG